MKHLVDRVMCEAGFYAPDYAALALKQSEGSLEEAVFLTRAYTEIPRTIKDLITRFLPRALKRSCFRFAFAATF